MRDSSREVGRRVIACWLVVFCCGCTTIKQKLSKNQRKKPNSANPFFEEDSGLTEPLTSSQTAKFYTEMASVHATNKQYEKAQSLFTLALNTDHKHQLAYKGLSQVYLAVNKPDQALSILKVGAKNCPKSAEIQNELGVVYAKKGQFDSAITAMELAVKRSPRNRNYIINFAGILAAAGLYERAFQTYRIALPEAETHYRIAGVLHSRGDHQASMDQLELALRANPNHQKSARMHQQLSGNMNHIAPVSHWQNQSHQAWRKDEVTSEVTNANYNR